MSVRMLAALPLLAATSLAQQSTQQSGAWTIDASGHRVEGPGYAVTESPAGGQRVQTQQSINGRMVPIQSIEDHVISQDSRGKVVERVVRKYDPNGNLGPPSQTRIGEPKNPE